MRALLAATAILLIATVAVDASHKVERSIQRIGVPTRRPSSRSSVTIKICESPDPRMRCTTNCTTYVVKPKHCFNSIPNEALEFNCLAFPSCIEGSEYINNTCAGRSLEFSAPCNRCIAGRLTTCSSTTNTISHYRCHDHECSNRTECHHIFDAPMGQCSTINPEGFFNISIDIDANRTRCSMVRIDRFFNNDCQRRDPSTWTMPSFSPDHHHHPWTFAPGHTWPHHHSEAPTQMPPNKKAMAAQEFTLSPDHHHDHFPHHMTYYAPSGKCQETEGDISVEYSCKSAASTVSLPEATPEILAKVYAHMKRSKESRHMGITEPHVVETAKARDLE